MEVPATALSKRLQTELAQECMATERAYLAQLSAATDLALRIEPGSDRIKAELELGPSLHAIDTWLSRLSGIHPGTFKLFLLSDPSDLAAIDRDQLLDHTQVESSGGISFVSFGFGLVFTNRVSEEPATRGQLLRAAAHELAHMHALNLLRIAFCIGETGTISPKMLMASGFTLSRNGSGNLRYEHVNEYWAEMAALLALYQLNDSPLVASTVHGLFENIEMEGPRYAAEQSVTGRMFFTIAGLIAAAFGEADRLHNWPLWHAICETVLRAQPFDSNLVDAAMHQLAGANAPELLDRVMTDKHTIERVSSLLSDRSQSSL